MTIKTHSFNEFQKKHILNGRMEDPHSCRGNLFPDEMFLKDLKDVNELIFEFDDYGEKTGERMTIIKKYVVDTYDDFLLKATLVQ